MTPHTVHLLAQLVRHSRAMLTCFEKWLIDQPMNDTQSDPLSAARDSRPADDRRSESAAPVAARKDSHGDQRSRHIIQAR